MGLKEVALRVFRKPDRPPDVPEELWDAPAGDKAAWRFTSRLVGEYRGWKPFNSDMWEHYVDNQLFGLYANEYIPQAQSERVKEILIGGLGSILKQKAVRNEALDHTDWLQARSKIVAAHFMEHYAIEVPILTISPPNQTELLTSHVEQTTV